MKNLRNFSVSKKNSLFLILLFSSLIFGQNQPLPKNYFWQKVQFGGGIGLNIGSGFTDITLAPSAIYNFNNYISAGVGLQGSYVSSKNYFSSSLYGASLITLINPAEQVQLSLELEQARVNRSITVDGGSAIKNNFWNTALFFGVGYRTENLTVGVRYNILYNKNDFVYSEAFMPFVRIYF